jgi:hypothetical protein
VATLSLGCLEFPITLDISPGLPDDNPNAPGLLAKKMLFQDPRSGRYFQFLRCGRDLALGEDLPIAQKISTSSGGVP